MKKLKLHLQNIEGAEVLTRQQLKRVIGGEMGSSENSRCRCNDGTQSGVSDCDSICEPACKAHDGVKDCGPYPD